MIARRFQSQMLAQTRFEHPAATVAWFGAMQAQDYSGALWAVGLRTRAATEALVEQALAAGEIVRTWPMRGTLHFVAAADVRWLLDLLAPRVLVRAARRLRQLELDGGVISRASRAFVRALQGGRRLTRERMRAVLQESGIDTSGQRAYHLLWCCAHERLICPGPRQGKAQTFVLLDEWVPYARPLPREEALAQLALRYFRAHGPATLRDFTRWSGLAAADAREAIGLLGAGLARERIAGEEYWLAREAGSSGTGLPPRLLPSFDEYLVGYTERAAVLDPAHGRTVNAGGGLLNPSILLDGRVAGVWKRTLRRNAVAVQARLLRPPRARDLRALRTAATEYAAFLGRPLELSEQLANAPE